jgi:hypothetical protein
MVPRIPLHERFWKYVDKTTNTNGCWLWTGALDKKRYGQIMSGGHIGKGLRSHRVSWEIANGPIPPKLEVCHDCPGGDNPSCVNPAHLFLGTHAENMRDAAEKGLMSRGQDRHMAKITERDVRQIRYLSLAGTLQKEICAKFGICRQSLYMIINRRTWKHVA